MACSLKFYSMCFQLNNPTLETIRIETSLFDGNFVSLIVMRREWSIEFDDERTEEIFVEITLQYF